MLRVRGQPREDDLADVGGGREESGHFQGVALVLPHADVKCLHASVRQEGVERTGDAARSWVGRNRTGL